MAYKANRNIKVPESYIQKIRDTKTKSAALKKYGNSTDPKMREALRRFYGSASVVAAPKDSARTRERTLPKSSVDIKAKTTTTGSRTGGKVTTVDKSKSSTSSKKMASTAIPGRNLSKMTPAQRKQSDNLAKFGKNVLYPVATSILPVTKGALVAKAVYGAAAKTAGVGAIKTGVKKGIATKGELSAARSTARGIVKDDIKLKSKTAKIKATNIVKSKTKNATALQRANSIRKASKAGK